MEADSFKPSRKDSSISSSISFFLLLLLSLSLEQGELSAKLTFSFLGEKKCVCDAHGWLSKQRMEENISKQRPVTSHRSDS